MKVDRKDDVFICLEQKFARQMRDELRTEATDSPISLEIFNLGNKYLKKNKSEKMTLDLDKVKRAKQVHFGNNADFNLGMKSSTTTSIQCPHLQKRKRKAPQ